LTFARQEACHLGRGLPCRSLITGQSGQATVLMVAIVFGVLACSTVGWGVARVAHLRQRQQSIADIAALSGARTMWSGGSQLNAEAAARQTAAANGVGSLTILPPQTADPPQSIRIRVNDPVRIGAGDLALSFGFHQSSAAAVSDWFGGGMSPGPGDYKGPFVWRQGKPMRPDVAIAFDRMQDAAQSAGVVLTINSAWRSSAEQATLFAAHPDPKWVAPPGHSLHRLGTELDLGPPDAYGWLANHAGAFGFIQRYSWEAWHFGYTRSPGSTAVGFGRRTLASGRASTGVRQGSGALQAWVPARYRELILAVSKRRGVSAALLAAQIRAESDFQPGIVSSAGAQGISQLMPDESSRLRVDPFDPAQAIDAQARLMRQLLARFAAVPLALAAYNAGPNAVARCGCVPNYTETQAYVRRILGWLRDGASNTVVRLIS